jgi:hypothetical protein
MVAIRIVVRILDKLEKKVGLFVVKVIGQPTPEAGEDASGERRGRKRMESVNVDG